MNLRDVEPRSFDEVLRSEQPRFGLLTGRGRAEGQRHVHAVASVAAAQRVVAGRQVERSRRVVPVHGRRTVRRILPPRSRLQFTRKQHI